MKMPKDNSIKLKFIQLNFPANTFSKLYQIQYFLIKNEHTTQIIMKIEHLRFFCGSGENNRSHAHQLTYFPMNVNR